MTPAPLAALILARDTLASYENMNRELIQRSNEAVLPVLDEAIAEERKRIERRT